MKTGEPGLFKKDEGGAVHVKGDCVCAGHDSGAAWTIVSVRTPFPIEQHAAVAFAGPFSHGAPWLRVSGTN